MRPRRGSSGSLARRRPDVGEVAVVSQRAQLAQRALAIANESAVGWLDERKGLDVTQLQRMHLQDDGGQVGALDLRLGEFRAREKVLLGVQADRDARTHATATARALAGGSLRDLLDGQALQPAAMTVTADSRHAGVDDGADPGHRQRGLGHVGGEHDAPPAGWLENALLFVLAEARIERQHLAMLWVMFAQRFGGLADLAFAAQEDQDVAGLFAPQLVDGGQDGLLLIRRGLVFFVELARRGSAVSTG